jgi:hypothetical protein
MGNSFFRFCITNGGQYNSDNISKRMFYDTFLVAESFIAAAMSAKAFIATGEITNKTTPKSNIVWVEIRAKRFILRDVLSNIFSVRLPIKPLTVAANNNANAINEM